MERTRRRISARKSGRAAFAVLVLLALGACSDVADELPMAPPDEPSASLQAPGLQDFGPAIRATDRHTPSLMANPAVVGTGVGLDEDGHPSIRLFLAHGNARGLPERLDGVPVSVEVTGPFHLRQDRTARARPAPIGFSVGHPDITAGTLGARVTDGSKVFILSNNHVLANVNAGTIGDPILQPGSFDGGSQPGDIIGTLYDFYPISSSQNNTMDAALALVDPADVSGSAPDGAAYGAPTTNIRNATVGLGVQKYGRTTGHTTGTVEEVNVTVAVCMRTRGPFQCAESATFVGQFTITDGSFSDGGDSGSLIVTGGRDPVGLLFAGSSTRTIANPIGVVLDHFGVSIDPTVPDGSDPGDPGDPDDPVDPDPAEIDLGVTAYKVQGRKKADLSWSGAASTNVDVFRDGALVATVANSGSYTDHIDTRGGGSHSHQVCEAGSDTCSSVVTTSW